MILNLNENPLVLLTGWQVRVKVNADMCAEANK